MIDIVISVACYNNEKEIIVFARNLKTQTISDRIKLVVSCNSCFDIEKFSADLKNEYPLSEVYNPQKNLGYLNGCLYGFQNQTDPFKWGLISNTDIDFTSNDFFEKVLEYQDNEIWCVGPDIVLSGRNIHQNPYRVNRPSRFDKRIRDFIFSYYCFYMIYLYLHYAKRKLRKEEKHVALSSFVYALHGSCFILRKECIDALLAENNQIFMYDEEFFIAEVVYKLGKKVFFDSSLGVLHNENQTTGKINHKIKQKWFKQSIDYLKKFY